MSFIQFVFEIWNSLSLFLFNLFVYTYETNFVKKFICEIGLLRGNNDEQ